MPHCAWQAGNGICSIPSSASLLAVPKGGLGREAGLQPVRCNRLVQIWVLLGSFRRMGGMECNALPGGPACLSAGWCGTPDTAQSMSSRYRTEPRWSLPGQTCPDALLEQMQSSRESLLLCAVWLQWFLSGVRLPKPTSTTSVNQIFS